MNASYVDFTLPNTTLTFEGPAAKDETLTYLEVGQYRAKAGLYKAASGLPVTNVTPEKNVPVIAPNDGQSWHTLYIWLYRTKSGGTGITTSWPPNPNDAADVAIGEIAGAGNGLLTIANKSETGDVIRKLRIDAAEIVFGGGSNPSFTKDMEWTTVLSPGQHTVEFMPARQNHYGITLTVQIQEGEVTTLSYFDRLADPDLPPPDAGYGSGMIKIVNNSTGVVYSAAIRNTSDNTLKSYGYNQFTPPSPVNYNQIGRVGVVGDEYFPITDGTHYMVLVGVELIDGYALIERRAALKDQVVEIVINAEEISKVHGADVTLVNRTGTFPVEPVEIVGVTFFNEAKPGEQAAFSGGNWNPAGYVQKDGQATFRVNSSVGMPITSGDSFGARITLYGNGRNGTIEKGVGSLYDTSRTITVTDADIPAALKKTFVPVTGASGLPASLSSSLDGVNAANSVFGSVNLNAVLSLVPAAATVQGPLNWTINGGNGAGLVTLNNGVLSVKNTITASDNGKSVTVGLAIPGAGSSGSAKADYQAAFPVTLNVTQAVPANIPVTSLSASGGAIDLLVGEISVNLTGLVTINPADAIVNGSAVTKGDITWTVGTGGYVSLVNAQGAESGTRTYLKGLKAGSTTVTATIVAARTGGTARTVSIPVTVTAPRPTERIVRIIRPSNPGQTITGATFIKADGSKLTGGRYQWDGTLPAYSAGSATVPLWQTGQTGKRWAAYTISAIRREYDDLTSQALFKLYASGSGYSVNLDLSQIEIWITGEKYADITLPFGADGTNKYFVFFFEGTGRASGTGNGSTDISMSNNYLFYVDLDNLPDVTRNGASVVPIFYNSYTHVAGIGIDFSASPPVNKPTP
jgi:hypothetical protein